MRAPASSPATRSPGDEAVVQQEHLGFLAALIAAKLRERPVRHPTTSTWGLPGWMKAAKHRAELLRATERLRATLDTTR